MSTPEVSDGRYVFLADEAALAAQMKVKDGKPIIDRIGGDMNLEALTESM